MEALFNKENVARPTAVAADISKDLKGMFAKQRRRRSSFGALPQADRGAHG